MTIGLGIWFHSACAPCVYNRPCLREMSYISKHSKVEYLIINLSNLFNLGHVSSSFIWLCIHDYNFEDWFRFLFSAPFRNLVSASYNIIVYGLVTYPNVVLVVFNLIFFIPSAFKLYASNKFLAKAENDLGKFETDRWVTFSNFRNSNFKWRQLTSSRLCP